MTTKYKPNLSDIGQGQGVGMVPGKGEVIVHDTADLHQVRTEHNTELSIRKRELISKVQLLEKKLTKNELKEAMLDRIINETYIEMDNLKENEFTRRGQKQSILIKQMEALSILQDTLLKYEDMIFKYQRVLIDIENNKLNSFIKIENLKKEEQTADENIAAIMEAVQDQLRLGQSSSAGVNPLLDEIQQELRDENYN